MPAPPPCSAVLGTRSRAFLIGAAFALLPLWAPGDGVGAPPGPEPRGGPALHREAAFTVLNAAARFEVEVGGAMDAENTRDPRAWSHPPHEGFQPNLSFELENLGTAPVLNPRIVVGDRGIFYSSQELVGRLVPPGLAADEAAFRIWDHLRELTYHRAGVWPVGWLQPLIQLGSFGFGDCAVSAHLFQQLLRTAGIEARVWSAPFHSMPEVWWGGGWHMLDVDQSTFYLDAQGSDLAGVEELVRDHALVRRNLTFGFPADTLNTSHERWSATQFDARLTLLEPRNPGTVLSLALDPGEMLRISWEPGSRFADYRFDPPARGAPSPRLIQGELRYRPDLSRPDWLSAATYAHGLAAVDGDGREAGLSPDRSGAAGIVIFETDAPFLIVGGSIRLSGWRCEGSTVSVSYSTNETHWEPVGEVTAVGDFALTMDLDPLVAPHERTAGTRYFLRLTLSTPEEPGSVRLTELDLLTHLMVSADYAPALRAGDNVIEYADDSPGVGHHLELRWAWEESGPNQPPEPPLLLTPTAGGVTTSSQPEFVWEAPADPDGDAITAHELLVSTRADFWRAVAPEFHRVLPDTTPEREKHWRPYHAHLLVPGLAYFWKVRSRDAREEWGPWSATRTFTVAAPGAAGPLHCDREDSRLFAWWDPPVAGCTPLRYQVHISAEQGFDPSPATLLCETEDSRVEVAGPEIADPARLGSFVKVQAVDHCGAEGPPSAPLELPSPFVTSEPPLLLHPGDRVDYAPAVLHGLRFDAPEQNDHTEIASATLPAWLALDPESTAVQGTPGPSDLGLWGVDLLLRDSRGEAVRHAFSVRVTEGEEAPAQVPLEPGWSLMAWNVDASAPEAAAALAGAGSRVGELRRAEPFAPAALPWGSERVDARKEIPPHGELLVRASAPCTLQVAGIPRRQPVEAVVLAAGWNLVPYLPDAADSVAHALASVGPHVLAVVGLDRGPRLFDAGHPAESSLQLLRPGRAYWLLLDQADTLRFPATTALPITEALDGPDPGGTAGEPLSPARTPYWCWLRADAVPGPEGDELAAGASLVVLDADGTVCGETEVEEGGRLPLLAIAGDDPRTAQDEGALPGEELRVFANGIACASGVPWTFGRILDLSPLGPSNPPPPAGDGTPELGAPYPTPARGQVFFNIALPGTEPAWLDIYTAAGRRLRELAVPRFPDGSGTLRWDGRDDRGDLAAPGLYFARLRQGDREARRKILLVR